MMKRALALLAGPRAPLAAAFVAVALTLPALGGGLFGDDYMQRSILLGVGDVGRGAEPVFDMFTFVASGPRYEAAMNLGSLTWWAHPKLRLALFRPLSALTHVLDYSLWPDNLWLQHLHSLLWYGLATFTVAALYRRIHGAGVVVGVAAVLFAVEDAHAMCASWLANRHALISLALGVAAVHAHVRCRRGDGAHWSPVAIIAFALALVSSEAALGSAAYIVAWQVTMEHAPWRKRLGALLPYGMVVAAWRVGYDALGYGTNGTALYIDPGHHPLDFLLALAERWPVLQLAQWFQAPADLMVLIPREAQVALAVVSVIVCVGLVWVFAPLITARREARFWAAGMALALVPLCAAFPMDRLLLFSGVGAFALMGMFVERSGLLTGNAIPGAPSQRRAFALLLLVLHGPVAAALLVTRIATLPLLGHAFESAAMTAPADESVHRQTFVFATGQEFPTVYLLFIRQLESPATAPRRVALLGSALNHNVIRREDVNTLVITAEKGFLHEPLDGLLRSLDEPFRIGDRIERPDFEAEVRAITADGRPAQVAFHFRAPLETAEFRWLALTESGTEGFRPPEIGSEVRYPAVSPLAAILHRNRATDIARTRAVE